MKPSSEINHTGINLTVHDHAYTAALLATLCEPGSFQRIHYETTSRKAYAKAAGRPRQFCVNPDFAERYAQAPEAERVARVALSAEERAGAALRTRQADPSYWRGAPC